MEAHDAEFGPVDIAVIGYPADAPMTGEAIPLLLDLVDRGVIRVLDVMFVTKNEDGTFSGFDARDLSSKGVGDIAVFEGASRGCSVTRTRRRPPTRSSRAAPLSCSSTRTAGPGRSSPLSAGTAACRLPSSGFPLRTSSMLLTPPRRPDRKD